MDVKCLVQSLYSSPVHSSPRAQNLQATFASCHHGQGLGGPLSTKYLVLGTMGLDFHEKKRVRLAHHVPSRHDVRQGSNEEKREQR